VFLSRRRADVIPKALTFRQWLSAAGIQPIDQDGIVTMR